MKKKTKENLKERIIDVLLELVLGVLCLAIGIGILVLLGKGIDEIDFEIAMLIGASIIIALIIIIYLVVKSIKKKKASGKDN
ncbi:MAG: hypothetical protein IJW10_02365 [Clostridia bacterium]|nr:hypothetical protein [Clostridia bacterium]